MATDTGAGVNNVSDNVQQSGNVEVAEIGNTERKADLMWIRGEVNGQLLDILLDSGATKSCIAMRCVTASPYLSSLPRRPYSGKLLVDVNNNPIKTSFEITCPLALGRPALSVNVTFVVVDDLSYSCIVGTNFLNKLETWGMNNVTGLFHTNNSTCPVFTTPQHDGNINLITKCKTVLSPGECVTVTTSPKGAGMNPFRPFSDVTLLTEGNPKLDQRTRLLIVPSVNVVRQRLRERTSYCKEYVLAETNHRKRFKDCDWFQ